MLKMTRLDGEHAYRASGVYDKWTPSGKCWSGGSFKSFLNYSKLIVENLLRDSERYKNPRRKNKSVKSSKRKIRDRYKRFCYNFTC